MGCCLNAWKTHQTDALPGTCTAVYRSCLEQYNLQPLEEWLLGWPAQSLLLSSAVLWCQDVTDIYLVRSMTRSRTRSRTRSAIYL